MKVMLDSGAYSAWRKKKEIDIDKYIEFVKTNRDKFEVCVNLDVIGDGRASYENWMYIRRQGLDTMPVFHVGTDEKWLEKYMRKCDYIGIGAIANLSAERRFHGLDHVWKKFLLNWDGKVHGMGLTDTQWLERFPWYSVDSISPVLQAAYGGIYVPRINHDTDQFDFLTLDMYKVSSKSKGHEVGTISSFFALSQSTKKRYEDLFQEKGYSVGKIDNMNKTPMFRHLPGIEEDTKTFANSYLPRVLWNLEMWAELMKVVRGIHREDMTVYVGSTSHFKAVIERELGSLLSFFIVNSNKQINNLVNQLIDEDK